MSSLLLAAIATAIGPGRVRAQGAGEAAPAQPPNDGGAQPGAAEERKGPPPLVDEPLLPELPTVAVRKGQAGFNVQMVDASLLPRDKEGIWVLDYAFKPVRIRTIDIPGKGRKVIHYLYYRAINRTGKPRNFVPQFTLVTDTGQRLEESVIPQAIPIIRAREDYSVPLLGAVNVDGMIPPSTREGIDDAVYGVAVWEGVDPKADRFSIYVRGLSDGYQSLPSPDGGKPVDRYKTLRIDFIRRGDERNLDEKEIQLNQPPYEWIYW